MAQSKPVIRIGSSTIRIEDVLAIASGAASIALDDSPAFARKVEASAALLQSLIGKGEAIYGVTTGFGASCETAVPTALSATMAANLVRFHGCGTGRMLDNTETAAVMVVRLVSLAQGFSGVRPLILQRICDLLNEGIFPQIPAEGSVGASGDLTPLSYIAAVLIGEREVSYNHRVMPAAEALQSANLKPIELRSKESLALMNGTSVMTGLSCIAYEGARRLCRWAVRPNRHDQRRDVRGNRGHFDERIFLAKPHPGQLASARWIAKDIEYHGSPKHNGRIQDRYSIRCAPHIVGVLLDSLTFIRGMLETEINSSNDNPLFDPQTGDVLHGGNFYGGHPCMAMDILKNGVANIADLIDRQMAQLCNPHTNNGLPADLVARSEDDRVSHHGFKAMQISASALAAEALKLTMPASVFSRSTESHNQDKVSMGTIAARDALRGLELTESVLAVVQLALCQAVDGCATSRGVTFAVMRCMMRCGKSCRSTMPIVDRIWTFIMFCSFIDPVSFLSARLIFRLSDKPIEPLKTKPARSQFLNYSAHDLHQPIRRCAAIMQKDDAAVPCLMKNALDNGLSRKHGVERTNIPANQRQASLPKSAGIMWIGQSDRRAHVKRRHTCRLLDRFLRPHHLVYQSPMTQEVCPPRVAISVISEQMSFCNNARGKLRMSGDVFPMQKKRPGLFRGPATPKAPTSPEHLDHRRMSKRRAFRRKFRDRSRG